MDEPCPIDIRHVKSPALQRKTEIIRRLQGHHVDNGTRCGEAPRPAYTDGTGPHDEDPATGQVQVQRVGVHLDGSEQPAAAQDPTLQRCEQEQLDRDADDEDRHDPGHDPGDVDVLPAQVEQLPDPEPQVG